MSKRIMLVDDSEILRRVVKIFLQKSGYEILECSNGQEAYEQLNGQQIHLIICDVNMPIMDGLTFARKMKEHPNYKFTPLIMLTTETQDEKKREGMEAGVKVWMSKPFLPDKLGEAVKRLLV